jgi:peptidoglycan/LPS O-acetylase OafA/YrhL
MAISAPGLIRDIEILRALAVLAVVLGHVADNLVPRAAIEGSLVTAMSGGWVGVDLFFAISGYVITRSFLPGALTDTPVRPYRITVVRFWVTRLFRLAPSAWLWLLIILVLCAGYNESGVFGSIRTNLYWTVAGVLNFSNYLFAHYFGSAQPGASFVYWSLSLEEQFYLLFPVVVWVFKRRLAWFLLALVVVQIFSQRGIYGMMFRTDAIALGILVAMASECEPVRQFKETLHGWQLRTLVILLLILLFYLGTYRQHELPCQVGVVALTAATLVFLCSGRRNVLAWDGGASRCLLWVGQRSYAIYLIHIPVMFFLRESAYRLHLNLADYVLASVLIAFFLIAALAAANYRLVETPLRFKGKVIASKLYANQSISD